MVVLCFSFIINICNEYNSIYILGIRFALGIVGSVGVLV